MAARSAMATRYVVEPASAGRFMVTDRYTPDASLPMVRRDAEELARTANRTWTAARSAVLTPARPGDPYGRKCGTPGCTKTAAVRSVSRSSRFYAYDCAGHAHALLVA